MLVKGSSRYEAPVLLLSKDLQILGRILADEVFGVDALKGRSGSDHCPEFCARLSSE